MLHPDKIAAYEELHGAITRRQLELMADSGFAALTICRHGTRLVMVAVQEDVAPGGVRGLDPEEAAWLEAAAACLAEPWTDMTPVFDLQSGERRSLSGL